MATITHPIVTTPTWLATLAQKGVHLTKAAGRLFATLNDAFVAQSKAQRCLETAERLSAKTDAELTELGLTRADIVHVAFRGFTR